jgi:hypothetical protein
MGHGEEKINPGDFCLAKQGRKLGEANVGTKIQDRPVVRRTLHHNP